MTEGRAIEVAAELQAQGLQAVRAERSNSYRSWVVRLNGGAAGKRALVLSGATWEDDN